MDAITLASALHASSFAEALTSADITKMAAQASWKRCAAGTVLFRGGEHNDICYVLHSGHVTLEMCLPARGCTRLLTLGPGELIVWSALVGDGRMTATATTIDEVELVELSALEIINLCEADASFGYRFMRFLAKALAKRLLATRLQLLDMFVDDASSTFGAAR